MIHRDGYNGPVVFICDVCNIELYTDTEDFHEALDFMKEMGWRSIPPQFNNYMGWGHHCDECRGGQRAGSQKKRTHEQFTASAPRKKAGLVMTRRLYRRIQGYLHPDREPDPEIKASMEEVFKEFTSIPIEWIDE
jgi:hypothetical protein